MELLDRINEDMKKALRAGEKTRLSVLRMLRSVIKNAEIAKHAVLKEADVLQVIKTEMKKRKESIESYVKAQRKELADQEKQEAEILKEYLPAQLSEAEIDDMISAQAQKMNVIDKKDFGKLMGAVMKETGVRADGGTVKSRVEKFFT